MSEFSHIGHAANLLKKYSEIDASIIELKDVELEYATSETREETIARRKATALREVMGMILLESSKVCDDESLAHARKYVNELFDTIQRSRND